MRNIRVVSVLLTVELVFPSTPYLYPLTIRRQVATCCDSLRRDYHYLPPPSGSSQSRVNRNMTSARHQSVLCFTLCDPLFDLTLRWSDIPYKSYLCEAALNFLALLFESLTHLFLFIGSIKTESLGRSWEFFLWSLRSVELTKPINVEMLDL